MESYSKNKRTCKNGHQYYKTSDCPVCPICEKERKPENGLLAKLPAPARRALENKGIETALELSKYTVEEIKALHGMGPSSIPKLLAELKKNGLDFKKAKIKKGIRFKLLCLFFIRKTKNYLE